MLVDPVFYLPRTGTLPMLAALDMGSFDITNVGLVDGRDISVDGTAQDTHIADGTIHLTQADNDLRYVQVAGDIMTGGLQISNGAAALSTGLYTFQMRSGVADGTNAVGYILDTTNDLSDATADVLQVKNAGTTLFSIADGFIDTEVPLRVMNNARAITSGNYALQLTSNIADGATAVGFSLDTANDLADLAAKVFVVRNAGAQLFEVSKIIADFDVPVRFANSTQAIR